MAWSTTLGGADVTAYCEYTELKRRYNRPSMGEVKMPSSLCSAAVGQTEMQILDGATVKFDGTVWFAQDEGGEDDQFTTLQAYDGLIYLPRRYVQDADGDLSDPSIIEDNVNAVDIFAAALTNTLANDGPFGPLGISIGSTSPGGESLIGMRPVDWPMTMEQLRVMLVNAGKLDVVVNGSTVDLYNGDYGSDLSGSVQFDYATGSHNCVGAQRTENMDNVVTRLRYLLGPKRPQYDGDIQHWAGDVQKDDPLLPDPPQSTIDSLISSADAAYGKLQKIEIFDANGDENALRDLYYYTWQADRLVNTVPRTLVTMQPEPGIAPSFDAGDLIGVAAGSVMRGGWSGTQKVYEFTVRIDTEGNPQLTQLQTSGDDSTP